MNIFRRKLVMSLALAIPILGVGAVTGAASAATYFCSGSGTSGNCAQESSGSSVIYLEPHASASPAKSEAFNDAFKCGNDHVTSGCPFTSGTLDSRYNGDSIDQIQFTNYTDVCAALNNANVVGGASCTADYTAWVKDGDHFINVRYTNNHGSTAYALTSEGAVNRALLLEAITGGATQNWANHAY
jgi:hypothetical protein